MPIPGVTTDPFIDPLSLDAAKAHLNAEDSDDDAEIAWYLSVAIDWVTKKVSDITPTPVKMAILEVVRHLYDTQRGPGATPLDPDGGGDAAIGSFDFLTVPRVRELLGPYLLQPTPVGSFPDARVWPDQIEWDRFS